MLSAVQEMTIVHDTGVSLLRRSGLYVTVQCSTACTSTCLMITQIQFLHQALPPCLPAHTLTTMTTSACVATTRVLHATVTFAPPPPAPGERYGLQHA